ncbi:Coatomer subunit delta [Camellia lanceoleosa]|uniref:Coatomer subunit delta n=1 Tax=Camellia lanceoleosa TaxID=1840588 RepID=A0ACC0FRZ0_9ERIC|nr:Coatomer subunit delta [Camellia lanceoleosa]
MACYNIVRLYFQIETGGNPVNYWPSISGNETYVTFRYDSKNSILAWSVLLIDNSNRSGSMEFIVPPTDSSVFFPISVRFTAANTFSDLKVTNILPLRGGPSPKFSQRTLLSTENYEVA